jgi:hypothetical protein
MVAGDLDWSRRRSRRRRDRSPELLFDRLEKREVLTLLSALPASRASGPPVVDQAPAPSAAPPVGATTGFVPMFNGINLAGWFNPYDWGHAVARGGQVLLSSPKNFFLVTRATYGDFIMQVDVLIPPGGNSGIQFRSIYGHNFVQGPQADMDTGDRNWAGGLWFQDRGWLARPPHRARVVPGHWNHYQLEAVGDHVVITVNGKVTVDVYRKIVPVGHIALQDHGSPGYVQFRNVEIEALP